jgi:hypothetical protein
MKAVAKNLMAVKVAKMLEARSLMREVRSWNWRVSRLETGCWMPETFSNVHHPTADLDSQTDPVKIPKTETVLYPFQS